MISFFRQSIAAKITLMLTTSLIVSALVFSSVLLLSANKFFKDEDERLITESINKQELELTQYYESKIKIVRVMASLVKSMPDDTQKLLEDFMSFYPELEGYSLNDRESTSKVETQRFRSNQVLEKAFDLESDFYRENALKITNTIEFFPIVEKKIVSRPGSLIPLLRARITTPRFTIHLLFSTSELIDKYKLSDKNKVIFLADKSGVFILHPSPLKQMSYQKEIKYFLHKEFNSSQFGKFLESKKEKKFKGNITYKTENRELYVKKVSLSGQFSFYVGGHFPSLSKLDLSRFVGRKNILMLLLLLFFLIILGALLTRYLLKNLDEVTEQAKLFTQGEHDIDIQVKSSDEIGILALTFQGMIRQVNERARVLRKSERRIREAKDQAEQALSAKSNLLEDLRVQKAEIERVGKDKDELLAIVSHDLKNPLAVVETSMDLIIEEEEGNLSDVTNDLIRRSKSSAKTALNLITDLLDLARLEGGIRLDFERFSVAEVINNVADSFFLKAREKNITISVADASNWEIVADYGRLIQVFSNILGNSLKFTPQNGHINIDFKKVESDFVYEGSDSGIEVCISDNGPGIPVDKLETIFDKFEQARKKDREIGTGLGLAICKNICEMHNGDILVESIEGSGASFTIKLPRLMDEDFTEDTSSSTPSLSILVVNDNEGMRKRLKSLLLSGGNYSVLEAKNGEEMLQVLDAGAPGLIILDDDMPVMNGLEAYKEMQRIFPSAIPTLFLAEGLEGEELSWITKQVSSVLNTDFKDEEIIKQVESLAAQVSSASVGTRVDPYLKTVLVVDDEEGIRELIMEELGHIGVNALAAKNGVEALFLIQKYPVNLVISDIRMAEMDGLNLTKVIKKDYSEIEVILMSATVDGLSAKVSETLGVRNIFAKPFDMKEMSQEIIRLLDSVEIDQQIDKCDEVSEFASSFVADGRQRADKQSKIEERVVVEESIKENFKKEAKQEKILLVDDSEDMQALFKAILRKESYAVETADNGAIGVENFKKDSYAAIFMDMNMPVMGGIEAVKKMRAHELAVGSRPTKVILLTANSLDKDSEELKSGFDGYIQKPISKKKIIQVLEE